MMGEQFLRGTAQRSVTPSRRQAPFSTFLLGGTGGARQSWCSRSRSVSRVSAAPCAMFLVARRPGGRAVPTVRQRPAQTPIARRALHVGQSVPNVHQTALVHEKASIHPSASIGPFCIVGPGAGVVLSSHTSVAGRTTVGDETRIESYCALGYIPQDKKYQGESSLLEIGSNCLINNRVVIHTGTRGGGGVTRLGKSVVIGEGSHVAHDCIVADNVTLSRGSTLAGHVIIDDNAHIGTNAGVVQRSRIGRFAAVSAESAVSGSVIPYAQVHGNKAKLMGLNTERLLGLGASARDLELLQGVIRYIFAAAEQVSAQLQPLPWPTYPTLKERAKSVKRWYEQGATTKRRRRGALWSLEASSQTLLLEILNFVLQQERRLVLP